MIIVLVLTGTELSLATTTMLTWSLTIVLIVTKIDDISAEIEEAYLQEGRLPWSNCIACRV